MNLCRITTWLGKARFFDIPKIFQGPFNHRISLFLFKTIIKGLARKLARGETVPSVDAPHVHLIVIARGRALARKKSFKPLRAAVIARGRALARKPVALHNEDANMSALRWRLLNTLTRLEKLRVFEVGIRALRPAGRGPVRDGGAGQPGRGEQEAGPREGQDGP